jgi:glyoxylase-like metal-dependent hydrolase (beta-lactamase superfamily II)
MSLRLDIVHIGTLSRNVYWGESTAKRTASATMTVVQDAERLILVDPGLPPELIPAVLDHRLGKTVEDIDMVFLTSRRAAHTRGLAAFPDAKWYMFEPEIEEWAADREAVRGILDRLHPAPERLTDRVHIFPTRGPTAGHCSLLIAAATATLMIAGDAVLTRGHFEHGAVFDRSANIEAAKESLAEIVELADVVVPGHDNIFHARGTGMF